MPSDSCRYLYTVEAEADPQLAARILGLFTQRGCLPGWFSARCISGARLRVVVEIGDLDQATCEHLARKLLNIPTVLDVSLRRLAARSAVPV